MLGTRTLGTVLMAAGTLLPAGCREPNTFVPPPPPQVTVAGPVRQAVVTYYEFAGRTAPSESVELRARVSGILEKIHFEEGTTVAPGAPLYDLEQAPYVASLQAAKAELARIQAELAEAKSDLDRITDLQTRDAASERERIVAQARFDSTAAAAEAAAAQVTQAELNLGYTRITAPIAGRINRSQVDVGNLVGQGEPTLLTTIVSWDPIHVYFTVGERDLLALRRRAADQGEPDRAVIPVYLRPADGSDYPLSGRIDYADNRVDPQTGTIQVRAVFDNPRSILVPGVFARVRIPSPPRDALLVPEVALQRDLAGYYLLTVNAQNIVERRNVEVAEQIGSARMIAGGLPDDARVVINGLQRARPGAAVNPQAGTFTPESGPAATEPGQSLPVSTSAAPAAGDTEGR